MSIQHLATHLGISPQQAERLVRHSSPANFAAHYSGGAWKRARHLSYLSDCIVDSIAGRRKNLLVEIGPRHGKSLFISRWVPAWFLTLHPTKSVILTSYALDFAVQWGRQVRNTLIEFEKELGVGVAPDSQSAQRWNTTQGGGMYTVGAGGPILGRGADLLVVDDPIKNAEEANSATQREALWEWWQSTVFTRIEPGGTAIVLHQRWHTDDLIGRLLAHEPDEWERIRFPALAEEDDILGRAPGEALWPERFDEAALERIRKTVGSYYFGALYQQDPVVRGGGYFSRDWFRIIDVAPSLKGARIVRFWDLAASDALTKKGDPDYTVGTKVAKTPGGDFIVLDVIRERKSPNDIRALISNTAHADGVGVDIYLEQEPGSAGQFLVDQIRRTLEAYRVYGFKSSGPKESYYDDASAKAEGGLISIMRGRWNHDWFTELEAVPQAKHDDQADAFSKAIAVLVRKARWGVLRFDDDEPRPVPPRGVLVSTGEGVNDGTGQGQDTPATRGTASA